MCPAFIFSWFYPVEPALPAHQTDKSISKSQADNGEGDKGVTQKSSDDQYNFTEEEEREIARWIESNRLLYEINDKKYKDKALSCVRERLQSTC